MHGKFDSANYATYIPRPENQQESNMGQLYMYMQDNKDKLHHNSLE